MKYFSLELTAQSPLAIRSDHAAGGADTAKYISGTTLAGSLAAAYRLLHSKDADTFESLFLSGKVLYPDLYPASFKDTSLQELNFPVYPLPKTAQTCKRFSGFQYMTDKEKKDGEEQRHGVRDSLFDWTLFNLSRETQKDITKTLNILDRHKYCTYDLPGKQQSCHETMEPFSGYYCRDDHDPKALFHAEVDKHLRLQTHTGIDRESGTVQESILYNRQVFDDGMRFWGVVKVDDDDGVASQFQDFLAKVGGSGLVRVGTGRTRGLGRVSLAVKPVEDQQDRLNAFKDKLAAFQDKLSNEAGDFLKNDLKPFYFALTLHSPTILHDDLLSYRGSIDTDTLVQLIGPSSPTCDLVYQCASIRRITGWNELWGTPRTNEYAIDTGSVFMFACPQGLDKNLRDALFRLEEQGIGRRRAEGFGRVCISDPFHREVKLI